MHQQAGPVWIAAYFFFSVSAQPARTSVAPHHLVCDLRPSEPSSLEPSDGASRRGGSGRLARMADSLAFPLAVPLLEGSISSQQERISASSSRRFRFLGCSEAVFGARSATSASPPGGIGRSTAGSSTYRSLLNLGNYPDPASRLYTHLTYYEGAWRSCYIS